MILYGKRYDQLPVVLVKKKKSHNWPNSKSQPLQIMNINTAGLNVNLPKLVAVSNFIMFGMQ